MILFKETKKQLSNHKTQNITYYTDIFIKKNELRMKFNIIFK